MCIIWGTGQGWGLSVNAGDGLKPPGENAELEVAPTGDNALALFDTTIVEGDEAQKSKDLYPTYIHYAHLETLCVGEPSDSITAELLPCSNATQLLAKPVGDGVWEVSTSVNDHLLTAPSTPDQLVKRADGTFPPANFYPRQAVYEAGTLDNPLWSFKELTSVSPSRVIDYRGGDQSSQPGHVVVNFVAARREEAEGPSGHSSVLSGPPTSQSAAWLTS